MKKFLTITSRSLFVLVLLFCIFKSFTILADTTIFQITKIEVKEKSEGVVVNNVSLSGGTLNNDIIFSQKDEFIKYNITIKNNTNSEYIIKTITDNNESTYLEYTYDNLANTKVEGKSELTFELQIKYVNEASGLYISNEPVSLTLTYEKEGGDTSSEVVTPTTDLSEESFENDIENPNTGDNLNIYIIIGLISLAGLGFTFVNKKSYFKTLMFIGLFSILAIPFGAKADNDKFIIKFTTNKIQNTHADLISGPEFNLLMHKLSLGLDNLSIEHFDDEYDPTYSYYNVVNNDYTDQDNEYWIYNYDISAIERATDEEYEAIKDSLTEENIISTSESNNPAYMWFDDSTGTIYYYTPAKVLVMSEDSSFMFTCIGAISNLDLSDFDTIKATNMKGIFLDNSIDSLNLGPNFNTSNVTDMSDMFSYMTSLQELDLGDKFDTSKVTNMTRMFSGLSLQELDLGDNFDTSNVTNMARMFAENPSLLSLNIGNKFDTSNVTNMAYMFEYVPSLEELDLGDKFNTSKVKNMSYMFSATDNLATIYVAADFDLSSLENGEEMFGGGSGLIGEYGTSVFNADVTDASYARIDDPGHNRPGYFTLSPNIATYGELISGPEFNLLMHKLSTGNNNLEVIYDEFDGIRYSQIYDNDAHNNVYDNVVVTSIKKATLNQLVDVRPVLSEVNIISTNNSDKLIYMWFDDNTDTIYYYSAAQTIMVNEDASIMFSGFNYVTTLDFGSIFDTSNVTNMFGMFGNMYSLQELDLGDNFDTSKVTNMIGMFCGLEALQELDLGDKFDTSNVIYMMDMLSSMYGLKELNLGNKFDTSKVTDMSYMFTDDTSLLIIDLGNKFDTSKVINMEGMFNHTSSLQTIYTGTDFDLSSLEFSAYMFSGDSALVGGNGTEYDDNHIDAEYARIDDPGHDRPGYFTIRLYGDDEFDDIIDDGTYSKLISGPEFSAIINELSIGNVTTLTRASSTRYYSIKNTLSDSNLISASDSDYPAYIWYERSDDFSGKLYYYSPAELLLVNEDASNMFSSLWQLQNLDLRYFDTSNVTNMSYMFNGMNSLTTLDLGDHFDTSNVTDMSRMFSYLPQLAELDLGDKFDTSNVINMSEMFFVNFYDDCSSSLVNLNLGNKFDTSNVTDMSKMFAGLYELRTLDLGDKFNTSKVTDMSGMFIYDFNLETIYISSDFDLSSLVNSDNMFGRSSVVTSHMIYPDYYDNKLVGGSGTVFDSNHLDSEYARIDDPEHGRPGYFTSNKYTNMISGPEFNELLRNNYYSSDVAAVKPATSTQYNVVKSSLTDLNVISTDDSAIPAYLWLDDDTKTLYYYSEAGRILMNEDASSMFSVMMSISSIDLSGFDTRNVTDMSNMFSYLPSLEEINFGPNFDTSNVTDMSWMFYIDISEYGSEITTLDLSGFDTSSVTNMSHMFMGLRNLQTLDLGDKFDTSNVTDMSNMFVHTTKLQTIYVANDFDLSSVEQGDELFGNFSSYYSYSYVLVGGAGTAFDKNHVDSEYARIDDPTHGRPGYFTLRQN